MVDAHALTRLVGDVADFLDVTFGQASLHVPASGRPIGAGDLLTIDDVDHLVAATGLRSPGFRLVRQGETLPVSRVTRKVRIGSRPVDDLVDVAAVHREVGAGATLVLQGLHRSFAPVASFCRDLERTLTHPVQANAYLTPPVAQGLDLHEDPHDVFAVQSYGSKRWVVHPPDGGPAWDLELRPGDVLYLPAGTRHAAQTVDDASLHLTIGVRTVTWRRIIEQAVDAVLAGDADLDRSLPAGWAENPGDLVATATVTVQRVAQRLADATDHPIVIEREAERFWGSRTPDRSGGLRDIIELDRVDDRTPLRRRGDVSVRVLGVGASPQSPSADIEVVLADRTLRLPASVAPALHRVIAADRLQPSDLDDLMDGPSRLVLTRRLVREGVLTIERDPVGA